MDRIRTSDLYYGAYLMSSGEKLIEVSVEDAETRKVYFEFRGEDVAKLTNDYISGEAVVNMRQLKSSLKYLKTIVYEKLAPIPQNGTNA